MTNECVRKGWSIFAVALFVTATPLTAEPPELADWIPGNANLLMAVDADKLFDSAVSKREEWRDQYEKAFVNQPLILHPQARRVITGSIVDIDTMTPVWEIGMVEMKQDVDLKEAAKGDNRLDELGGKPTLWTPLNTYVVGVDARVLGVVCPANRQFTSRWVRQKQVVASRGASGYLRRAVLAFEGAVLIAMDLQDIRGPQEIRERIGDSEALKKGDVDLDALSQVLATIEGVKLELAVTDRIRGKARVDFGEEIPLPRELARPYLLEVLDGAGVGLEDLKDWKVSKQSRAITLEGELTTPGLRRVLSLLELPLPLEGQTGEATQLRASQRYFGAIAALIDDLQGKGDSRAAGFGAQEAVWMNRYARKIDRLPMQKVDPELLDYGEKVSEKLRSAADTLQEYQQKARVIMMEKANASKSSRRTAAGSDHSVRAQEEQAAGAAEANRFMSEIQALTANTRRTMAERYSADF